MSADSAAVSPAGGRLGWGILATGGVAKIFARDLAAHGFRVQAVGSRSIDSARAFAEQFSIPTAHGSYEELVADPDVDIVYVATPHNMHAAGARLALEAGKHVLVEKAFTLTAAEAQELVDLAAERGLVVLEAMWTRFLPHMAYVRQVIAEGRIGAVRLLHADHSQRLAFGPEHRLNRPDLAGGALLDLGVYPISFAHDILGPPTRVRAEAVFAPSGVDAAVAAICVHDGGAISTSYATMECRGRNEATILGTAGRLELASMWYMPGRVRLFDEAGTLVEEFDGSVPARGMQFQAAEMERLVNEGLLAGTLIPPQGSVEVMRTLDEVRRLVGLRYPGE